MNGQVDFGAIAVFAGTVATQAFANNNSTVVEANAYPKARCTWVRFGYRYFAQSASALQLTTRIQCGAKSADNDSADASAAVSLPRMLSVPDLRIVHPR